MRPSGHRQNLFFQHPRVLPPKLLPDQLGHERHKGMEKFEGCRQNIQQGRLGFGTPFFALLEILITESMPEEMINFLKRQIKTIFFNLIGYNSHRFI